jgi:hypothetical protein
MKGCVMDVDRRGREQAWPQQEIACNAGGELEEAVNAKQNSGPRDSGLMPPNQESGFR